MKHLITALLLLVTSVPALAEDYVGINTFSRHFTADHNKYCEENWGGFYEHREPDGVTGLQMGYYRNSFCDPTVYVVGILQPVRIKSVQIGGFLGPAWGYDDPGKPVLLGGGIVTWHTGWKVDPQFIITPVVAAVQFRIPW